MICRHLREDTGLKYYRVEVPPGMDDYVTVLCESCDKLLWEEDGWTDRLFEFAGWQLFCIRCIEDRLHHHSLLGVGQLSPEENP